MILIAATAFSLALVRGLSSVYSIHSNDAVNFWTGQGSFAGRSRSTAIFFTDSYARSTSRPWSGLAAFWGQRLAFWSCPCLIPWTIAAAALPLVLPRPSIRRLMRRPGVAASWTFVTAFGALAITLPGALFTKIDPAGGFTLHTYYWWILICFALPRTAALTVIVSWITLALSGCWQPDGGWRDWIGIALGALWICVGMIAVLSSWLTVLVS